MSSSETFHDAPETGRAREEDTRLQQLLKKLSESALDKTGRVRWMQHLSMENILLLVSKASTAAANLKMTGSGGLAESFKHFTAVDTLNAPLPFAALLVCTTMTFSWACWVWRHRWLWMLGHSVV